MTSERRRLLDELAQARLNLWQILDGIDDAREVYPGVAKREFLAHIAGWEAIVFDAIQAHVSGRKPHDHGYTNVDNANARFVAVRASSTVHDVRLECEIYRFAIVTLLEGIDNYEEVIVFPYGAETVIEFIQGAIEHERDHAADLQALAV